MSQNPNKDFVRKSINEEQSPRHEGDDGQRQEDAPYRDLNATPSRAGGPRYDPGGASSSCQRPGPSTEVGTSSSIALVTPTTTAVPAVTVPGGAGGDVASRSAESSLKGRRAPRLEVVGGPVPKKPRGELLDPPQTDPACSICGKRFASWKAVFGHMRAHPEREWRGAFPPPRGGDWSPKQGEEQQQRLQTHLAPALLDLARQTLERIQQDPRTDGEGDAAAAEGRSVSASSSRPQNIDLNVEPQEPSPSTSQSSDKESTGIDLNKPPKNGGDGNGGSGLP